MSDLPDPLGKRYPWLADRYFKLRPPPATPADEICACTDDPPIKLMGSCLFENPIHCLRCNLEVVPERLALTPEEVEAVARWHGTFGAIEQLELDSGPYELWARAQLMDASSPVNIEGRRVAAMLRSHDCYYWWFQPIDVDRDIPALSACPVCGDLLVRFEDGIFPQLLCERDHIALEARDGVTVDRSDEDSSAE